MHRKVINLVRHCESEWHLENKYAGVTDIDLSEAGKKQAQELANWTESSKITRIISSDLKRAVNSATPLANSIQVKIELDPRFREVNFGDIEGLSPGEMESRYPKLREQFVARPAETQMPNGESGIIALSRVMPAILDCIKEEESGGLVIFTHGTIMRLIVCGIAGLELNEYRRIFPLVPNLGRFVLEIETSESTVADIKGGILRFDHIVSSN